VEQELLRTQQSVDDTTSSTNWKTFKPLEGLLEPEMEEPLGTVEVRAVFPVGSAVAGCYVLSGKLLRNKLRVRRGGKVIYEGTLDSSNAKDVREVNAGYECGIGVDKFNDWVEGDIVKPSRW